MTNGYPGSKGASGLAERIIREMPPHYTFVEAFAGHAAIYRRKRPASHSVLIDQDPSVCTWLRAIVDQPANRVDVLCSDALQLLPTLPALVDPRTLLYCDPPYLLDCRTRLLYDFEFETAEAHTSLLTLLLQVPCMVCLSGYRSPLYASMLERWRLVTINAMTRGGPRTECLWCNFPEPTVLHDPRFAGKNFRDRERLKRKAMRWETRFRGMVPRERQVIAAALAKCDRAAVEAAIGSANLCRPEKDEPQ
jgi:DNA adenine methylase